MFALQNVEGGKSVDSSASEDLTNFTKSGDSGETGKSGEFSSPELDLDHPTSPEILKQQFEEGLARGAAYYDYGEYQKALERLLVLEQDKRFQIQELIPLRIKLYLYLGSSYFFMKQGPDAREMFWRLLQLDPLYIPKSTDVPPEIVELFDDVRREHREELRPLVMKKLRPRESKKSWVLNLVPFGAGQFQNKQKGKAVGFIGAEAITLGFSIYSFVKLNSDQQSGGTFDDDQKAANLRAINLIATSLFWAIYGYQIVDGFIYY